MSFDLYIAPASGFLEWSDKQWQAFFESDPPPEDFRLGKSVYVGLVFEAISHNLEGDKAGSKFSLLMRIGRDDKIGWYHHEIGPLLAEIKTIKKDLAAYPINRSTLNYDNHEDVRRRLSDFREVYPDRPLHSLYDLNFYFIDGFEMMAKKALESGFGLVVFY